MLRTIFLILYLVAYLFYSLIFLVRVKFLDKRKRVEERDQLVNKISKRWAKAMVKSIGAKVEIIGEDNLPDGPVLLVGNHQSNFDIPILMGYLKKPIAFIAKIETKKIPVIKSWMEYMQCVFMDRQDIRQSLRAINQGVNHLKEGYSYAIFPEGTRSVNGELLDFKPGSLKLALKANVPIIPIIMMDTYKLMSKKSWSITPASVKVIICEPIYTNDLEVKDTKVLTNHIKQIIKSKLDNGTAMEELKSSKSM